MLKYNLIQRGDPRNRNLPQKWYATPSNQGRISIEEISKDIAGASSLSRGDISNVIMSLLDQVPRYLLLGQTVELGELGLLRISFSSEGVDKKEDFTANRIDDIKIIFTPSSALKRILPETRFEAE
jgi:predicted histone-like DNA-binding protein